MAYADRAADPAARRIATLDVLRGFALLGMILVHFHQKTALPASGPEELIGWVTWVGVEQKAWATFAFLFGVGFAVLLRRAESRGAPFVALYLRRLVALALFGVVAQVAFGFHILLEYAMWGVPLLLVRRWPTRSLVALAVLCALAGTIYSVASESRDRATVGPRGAEAAAKERTAAAAARWKSLKAAEETETSYAIVVAARLRHAAWMYSRPEVLVPGTNFVLFLVGLLALRRGVFDEPRRHVRLIAGATTFGLVSWAASWLLLDGLPGHFAVRDVRVPLRSGLGLVADHWLALTYVGAIVLLLAYRPAWTRRLAAFAWAGRMALTNYFVQIVLLDWLTSAYGVGLELRPLLYVVGTLLLFALEVVLSRIWLARFRFGPLEWLWRSLTYGHPQPMRPVVMPSPMHGAA